MKGIMQWLRKQYLTDVLGVPLTLVFLAFGQWGADASSNDTGGLLHRQSDPASAGWAAAIWGQAQDGGQA